MFGKCLIKFIEHFLFCAKGLKIWRFRDYCYAILTFTHFLFKLINESAIIELLFNRYEE